MENLVFEGFKFMILGMGTVFAFLVLMIVSMNLLSFVVHKFFPEPVAMPAGNSVKKKNSAKIAAISAAIEHHKNVKG